MEKLNASTGELWLPYILVLAIVAAGFSGAPRSPGGARPVAADGLGGAPAEQNIPARLWQDPLEAADSVRRALRADESPEAVPRMIAKGDLASLETLIKQHATEDGVPRADGSMDYHQTFHKVLFLFVSLLSDAYPESAEQRIRARIAVVSALSTAGYRPENAQRIGLAHWAHPPDKPPVTRQTTYPFEVFVFDEERRVLDSARLTRKVDEVVVIYVEENAVPPEQQLEWFKRLSQMLAEQSPPERFTDPRYRHLHTRFLGPVTSDRLVALLRSASDELRNQPTAPWPSQTQAMPIKILAMRPRISASLLDSIVKPWQGTGPLRKPHDALATALAQTPRSLPLLPLDTAESKTPWLSVERIGYDDAVLAEAMVRELKLRLPDLLPGQGHQTSDGKSAQDRRRGRMVLIGEWDSLYGRALPKSFESAFLQGGGDAASVVRFSYLRGLDGQVSGNADKPKADSVKATTDPADLFRQLLQSRAPSMAYGRTQVDYVDRLAAQLKDDQAAHPHRPIQAIGILGTDVYDKLLILRSLRKVFPSVQYFTSELDAALYAPDQYDATRNLLIVTGFDLRLFADYQRSILPFRDSGQASTYYGTLLATEYPTLKSNRDQVRRPLTSWLPAVFEVGRGGPYLLESSLPAGALVDASQARRHSPLPDPLESQRTHWRIWLSPLLALMIVLLSTLTHYGRLAMKRVWVTAFRTGRALLSVLPWRAGTRGLLRLARRLRHDTETWLLVAGLVFFVSIATAIPWIAGLPDQEPFSLSEGLSSWPATWLRGLAVFLCGVYFWIITCHFREALVSGQRLLQAAMPLAENDKRSQLRPWIAWTRFCRRTSGWPMKIAIVGGWMLYMVFAFKLFRSLDPPASVTRGLASVILEKRVLMTAVFSMNLLIVYAVAHNLSCAFFVREVADWLHSPDVSVAEQRPLHTALMKVIGRVGGAMAQMIYYPFTLLFLLLAARQPLFDNFDWPAALVIIFALSSGALLASTLGLRRSADFARRQAVGWLEAKVAAAKWDMAGVSDNARPDEERRALAQAEWQLAQVNSLGGAALSAGVLSNPLLRAVLIPLGGSGLLQLMEMAGKAL